MFFIFLFILPYTYAQELTIYTIPAPKPINWGSPKSLIISFLENSFAKTPYLGNEKHPIGHMLVELKDNTHFALVGSTTDEKTGNKKNVIKEGYGLGILFTSIKGKLEESDKNLHQIKERAEAGDIAFITVKINQSVFNRLWQYLQEYKAKGYDKCYNGYNKPREGLGAGCSAFAESFLEVGGLANALPTKEWAVQVAVPEALIGGPVADNKRVKFAKLFSAKAWANTNREAYRKLFLYEPTKLYHWINDKTKTIIDTDTLFTNRLYKANGFTIDCRYIQPPQEPIWLTHAN